MSTSVDAPPTRGVIYFAIGSRYAREAEQSARSAKKHMPALPVAIITDCAVSDGLFNHVIPAPIGLPVKRQKMNTLLNSPFERTIFCDTDTLILAPVWELFDLLDNFDAAMTLAPGFAVPLESLKGLKYFDNHPADNVPIAYPAWNSGVIAFRRSPEWIGLVKNWDHLYLTSGNKGEDQISLRFVCYRSPCRIAPLPPGYNYRLPFPDGIRGAVKILHGRSPHLVSIGRKLNRSQKLRAIVPRKYLRKLVVYGDSRIISSIKKRIFRNRSK